MNLSGKLPAGNADGLSSISRQLVDDPNAKRVVLAVVDASKVTRNLDTDDEMVTCRILRIEPLLREDLPTARLLLERAFEHRTGLQTLPFEVEQEIEEAFSDIDPDTGEIRGE